MKTFAANIFYNIVKHPVVCTVAGAVTVTAASKIADILKSGSRSV